MKRTINPGVLYDRLVFQRLLLVWVHIALAIVAGLLYLSAANLQHFAYWRPRASMAAVAMASIPMLPYLLSGIHSRDLVSGQRLGFWIFVLVLVIGTGVVGYWYVSGVNAAHDAKSTVGVISVQSLAYLWSAWWCLDRD
jgi:hypothetical protein